MPDDTADLPSQDVVFLALARDCADTIPAALRALDDLRDAGLRVHAIVGENGSRDTTRALLQEASARGSLAVVDTSFIAKEPSRLHRMALGRQAVADAFRELPGSARAVGVVDLDEPFLTSLDATQLRSRLDRLETESDLFALAATTRPSYYDLLAYEDEANSFGDLDQKIGQLERHPVQYYRLFRDVIYPEQRRLTSDADIRCLSAFNGLCLYPAAAYAMGTYLPAEANGWPCEHITFNRSVASATGRQMLIDGRLVLPMPAQHGHRALPGFVWQRVRKIPAKIITRVNRGR